MMWGYGDGRWHGTMHDGWAGWLGLGLFGLLVLAVLAALVVLMVRLSAPSAPGPRASAGPPVDPQRILEERFARGEIDEQEFRSRRDALTPR